jgi:hypothetical protein
MLIPFAVTAHLVAARHTWLKPDQIDTFLREVLW